MAKKIYTIKFFHGGIADSEKEGLRGSFFFSQKLDIFSEPTNITLLPKTAKSSSSTVVDLVKWIVVGTPNDTNIYYYGDAGHIYSSTNAGGSWSDLRTVSNSNGQGMDLYNDYIYYTQNTQIGWYGPLSSSPSFTDNWQGSLNDTSTSKFAPVKAFKEGFAVGNGNDLGWYDGVTWDQDKIVLPPGFNIRSLDVVDEFLAVGAWRGTSITDSEQGLVFFWDGSATTFNFFVEIPEGGVNALLNSRNRLLSMVGSNGIIYLNYNPFQKAHRIPKLEYSKYVEVYPGAVTNWKGIAHIGTSGNTDSTSIIQGVYQWGAKSDKYNEALNFAYVISTGTSTGTGMKIGAVKGIGNQMFIGWKDGSDYGVDRVIQTADPFANGTYEGLFFDDKRPAQDKLAVTLKALHKALASGESVQLGYKINRASSYTTGTANSTVGDTETRLPVPSSDARFKEIMFEVILATTGSTSPTVTAIVLEYDDMSEETLV